MKKFFLMTLIVVFGLILSSCDTSDPSNTGRLKVNLVDAPASLDSVILNVLRVEIHKSGSGENEGWIVLNEINSYFDLLKLTNGASVVIGDKELEPGKYTQIRLVLGTDNYVYDNGVKHLLTIPSGQESGLKLTHPFDIEEGNLYELYLDFNADKSISVSGTDYKLKPTIRVQAAVISGTISGLVLPLDAQAKVWTVAGTDTITTFTDEMGNFKLMALPAGTYQLNVEAGNAIYQPKTVVDVVVTAQQNTSVGTITLVQ